MTEEQPPVEGGDKESKSDGLNGVRAAFAAIVVVAFVVFAVFLVVNADTTEQSEWERWVYVFGAVEAIAFAAVGWLFGREVNRERAEKAEQKADAAEGKATTEATKGAKLAGMVLGGTGGASAGGRERLERMGAGSPDVSAGGLAAAVEFARRNYPDAS